MTTPTAPPKAFKDYFHRSWGCRGKDHVHGPDAVRLAWIEDADLGGFWRAAVAATRAEDAQVAREHYCDETKPRRNQEIAAAIERLG